MNENKDKKFINEKILGRNLTWGRALKYTIVSILCGALFGAAAFSVFWFAKKNTEGAVKEDIPEAAVPVQKTEKGSESLPETEGFFSETESIPATAEDPSDAGTEAVPETDEITPEIKAEIKAEAEGAVSRDGEPESCGTEETAPFDEAAVRELIHREREEYEYTLDDFKALSDRQQEAVKAASVHFVTVECTISETTWFESTIETKRQYSGVIVSKADDEILVLTVPAAADKNVSLSVKFSDGTRQNAIVKKYSERDRLAVLAVPTEGLGKDFVENVSPVEYAAKETVNPGTQIISAGAPLGVVGSYDFGDIGYVSGPVSTVDSSYTYCLSDIDSDKDKGTFFIDLNGNLIGIASDGVPETGCSCAVITESIEYIIESLKKNREMAYLGISGMDTSFEMKYKNVPEGMYVTELEENCPAYEGGIKQGDILILAGNREIRGTEDYKSFMRNLRPGETVVMKVMRAGASLEYKELELTLTAGAR